MSDDMATFLNRLTKGKRREILRNILLLIPGIAITTAVRDTLIGDTISGMTKLADCLVWAAALAAGIMIVISIFVR